MNRKSRHKTSSRRRSSGRANPTKRTRGTAPPARTAANAKAATTGKPAAPSPSRPPQPQARRAVRVPARWKWHHATLSALRDRFIRECKERLTDASQPIEPHSMSMADSATDDFDHDLALGLFASGQQALAEIEAALGRIEKGTYGVCEETGKAIPAARLKALPWARYRAEVEARRERNHPGAQGPHLGRLGAMG